MKDRGTKSASYSLNVGRRRFLSRGGAALVAAASTPAWGLVAGAAEMGFGREIRADVVVCGAGLGGIAAAIAACRNGLRVVLTEPTDWIGGQLTSQGVPPDEHAWIETHGATATYRRLRDGIRAFYRSHYPLTEAARSVANLNPGSGAVSRLCHEPRVALAVLESMLAPYVAGGRLRILRETRPFGAEVDGDRVLSIAVRGMRDGRETVLRAPWFVDASELGDLLPLAKVEYVTGCEGRDATGELHMPAKADSANEQAFTMCFAVDHVEGENHVIDRPKEWAFWRDFVPQLSPPWTGRLLNWEGTHPRTLEPRTLCFSPVRDDAGPTMNLWVYRRIAAARNFEPGTYPGDVSLINWPQNDYFLGRLVDVDEATAARHVKRAKQLSLSLLYWMQTEAPRPDGGTGWPGLRLRGDLLGTDDGLAKAPYVRESRRIRAQFTIREQDCGVEARARLLGRKQSDVVAEPYPDSVGIGHYAIDLHPTTGGDNYVDFPSLPFHIPLGALLPVRVANLLPANKNIGTTHVTNGGYRLHPIEWNIGEAVGELVAFAKLRGEPARAVREKPSLLAEFQERLHSRGIETRWPEGRP